MLEICFGDSVKGALRFAQHCGSELGGASAIGFIGGEKPSEEERKRLLAEYEAAQEERSRNAVPLGGDSRDVVSLFPGLSQGDILHSFTKEAFRRELVTRWFASNRWGEPEDSQEASAYWRSCLEDFERFKARIQTEPARIWVDQRPDTVCGLLFAAGFLEKADTPVTLVPLPLLAEENGASVRYSSWGELEPEYFGRYLSGAVELPRGVLRTLAARWEALRKQNAPLRALVNGQLVSVPADFYDAFIRQAFTAGRMKVGQLVGRVLGQGLGVGDFFIAERLRAMLETGVLRLVEEGAEGFYSATVVKG